MPSSWNPVLLQLQSYLASNVKDVKVEVTNPPANRNDSIRYTLYNSKSDSEGCSIEPTTEEFNRHPAGPGFDLPNPLNKLTSTDAELVDVINTSYYLLGLGLGLYQSIGRINFYPNGGIFQPHCRIGRNFTRQNGRILNIKTPLDLALCNHEISLIYYLNSINNCKFIAKECDNYLAYYSKSCSSNFTSRMGFHTRIIPELKSSSKFYLETGSRKPYCKNCN
ncbi:endothelial lipase [Caerostris extrusa]|uniref:Endothelial lipase n=1 Tax=Caerostris extrusa TaxID=172846 RepID=A0AAV4SED9_CAEEX|nr:endothelial lipase [Caerostris extrusa]